MDDVIFAGTADRPALGRAEVSLTIDNTSQLLPIEFSEVTITRTLFRTGESEYMINGAPCRLLDIQELLSDTGIGRQQHVIVGQGQLDAVLNARPEDRRAIIEEAAGDPEVPQAQGEGASAGSKRPKATCSASPTCCARCAASCARSSARPTPPAATTGSSPSSARSGCTSPGASSSRLRRRGSAGADAPRASCAPRSKTCASQCARARRRRCSRPSTRSPCPATTTSPICSRASRRA